MCSHLMEGRGGRTHTPVWLSAFWCAHVSFSNTLDHCQNIPARRRTRALDVALVVALVCGQSRNFHVYRRVSRRVPNRARIDVFCICIFMVFLFCMQGLSPKYIIHCDASGVRLVGDRRSAMAVQLRTNYSNGSVTAQQTQNICITFV